MSSSERGEPRSKFDGARRRVCSFRKPHISAHVHSGNAHFRKCAELQGTVRARPASSVWGGSRDNQLFPPGRPAAVLCASSPLALAHRVEMVRLGSASSKLSSVARLLITERRRRVGLEAPASGEEEGGSGASGSASTRANAATSRLNSMPLACSSSRMRAFSCCTPPTAAATRSTRSIVSCWPLHILRYMALSWSVIIAARCTAASSGPSCSIILSRHMSGSCSTSSTSATAGRSPSRLLDCRSLGLGRGLTSASCQAAESVSKPSRDTLLSQPKQYSSVVPQRLHGSRGVLLLPQHSGAHIGLGEDGEEHGGEDRVGGEGEAEAEQHGEVGVGVDEGRKVDVAAQEAEE
eukprot:scaffold44728_cov58-Phaeocystis_antarctica.AAC.3